MKQKRIKIMILPFLLLALYLSACSSVTTPKMLPLDEMPEFVRTAPVSVQQAYQFAAANPEFMTHIPCYCGCGDIGHTSNLQCYVSHIDPAGAITFDEHAIGCSICVDITHDAMRMLEEGKTTEQIKQAIDETYSKYGTSNMP
jgi:hypothetical protein